MNKILLYFLKLWKNHKIVVLFLFFLFICVILAILSKSRIVEKFDMNSLTSSISTVSIPGSSSDIPSEYDYLAPIPPGTVWSDATQNAYIDKFNIVNPATQDNMLTKEKLSSKIVGNKTWMDLASEKEAQYYIDNGMWQYDDYIKNFCKDNDKCNFFGLDFDKLQKAWPNRLIYELLIAAQTVPQLEFLNQLAYKNSASIFNQAENDQYWICTSDNALMTRNGTDGQPSATTDYSFFEKNIKDFQFTNGTCNPCAIPSIQSGSGGFNPIKNQYYDPSNKCQFTIGTNPEAYNIYMGAQGLAAASSPVSESSTTTNYQQCVSQCDKYKS